MHPIGAPGSIARFCFDHARDPSAKPFAQPWVAFGYVNSRVLVIHTADTREGLGRMAPDMVAVDVRTYGCAVAFKSLAEPSEP